jgi:phage terminase large subunit
MANENNLKGKGFESRTTSELREIARKGGKASGEARRRKADFRKTLNLILTAQIDSPEWTPILEAMGLESTIESAVNAAIIKEALQGDVKAYAIIRDTLGQTTKSDIDIEEQKAKIRHTKAQVDKLQPEVAAEIEYFGIPASLIAPVFASVIFAIEGMEYLEYVLPGGRGSTKSSFVGTEVVDLVMKNDKIHACVVRQVADTLRSSVYQQILWSIEKLGLMDQFHATVSPLEITRKSTGQKIYFRGADDPGKIKSIKVPFGHIGILWFEELDQFEGEEPVRKIEQSIIRGGEIAYIFKSFNPPRSAQNWANKYIQIPKKNRLVIQSTYLDVPKKWLGTPFIDEAEHLQEVNPDAYENEYLGVANGNGGNVFQFLDVREITDEEISQFDRIYQGVDWGWYPDPYAFIRLYYDRARETIYLIDENYCNKASNAATAKWIVDKGYNQYEVVCDSQENKSIENYREMDVSARPVVKGPGSVEFGMKWLQTKRIVIDPQRTPNAYKEFSGYEYDRNKNGDVVSGYPDRDNHTIDAVRYALTPVFLRKGTSA